MARIRTIKPDFWTDDLVGSLTREQRLLFIATWNLADDEGRLRWSPQYIKGAIFAFDDDLSVQDVKACMDGLEAAGVVVSYLGGRSGQRLAQVVNFRRHQKINRPSSSNLPAPPGERNGNSVSPHGGLTEFVVREREREEEKSPSQGKKGSSESLIGTPLRIIDGGAA